MSNFAQNVLTIGLSHEKQIRRTLMFIILGLSALSVAMWQVNAQGYKEWLYIPFFLGLLILLGKGTKPEVWSATILLGGVWNAAQLENVLRGAGGGVVWWFTKGLPGVIVFWLCLTGFLATWSFEQSPSSFFPLVGFSILIFFALTAWDKWEGEWMFNIVLYYSITIVLIALLKTTFLGEWIDWTTDPKAREVSRAEQIEERRQAEIEEAQHKAAVAAASVVTAPDLPRSVVVPRCGNEDDWVKVTIPAGWTFTPAWQAEIASFQVLPNDSAEWIDNPSQTSSGIGAVRFCTSELIYRDESMALTWKQL